MALMVIRYLITPGNETSFIDESSDRYGHSEQNIANVAAAALVEERAVEAEITKFEDELEQQLVNDRNAAFNENLVNQQAVDDMFNEAVTDGNKQQKVYDDEKAAKQAAIEANEKAAYQNQINTDFGTPDGFFAGSNDKSGYQTNSVYAAGETDEVKKAKAFEKAKAEGKANAVELMAEMKADNLVIEKEIEAEIELFEKKLNQSLMEDEIDRNLASTALAVEKREALEEQIKVEKEIEQFEAQLVKDLKSDEKAREVEEYKAEQDRIAAERLAKAVELNKQVGIDESAFQREKDVEKRIDKINDDLRKERIRKNTQDRFAQSQKSEGTSKAYLESVEAEKAVAAAKTEALKEQTLQSLAESKITERKLKDNAGTSPIGLGVQKRKADERAKTVQSSLDDEQSTNASNAKVLAEEKKAKETRARHDAFQNNRIDEMADAGDKASKRLSDKLAQNRKNQLNKEARIVKEQNKNDAILMNQRHANAESFRTLISGDPFAFSTLEYPLDVTNNTENGHYLLFYVNVQNKTGYKYEGVTPTDGDFEIGDWVERVVKERTSDANYQIEALGADEDNFAYKTRYEYNKGARKDSPDYQKRQILAGGSGNILRNNQKVLSKGRKISTGMESVHKTTSRITDSVALYLPPNVKNDLTSVAYQDFETGMAGFLALGGKGVLDQVLNNSYSDAAGKFMGMGATVIGCRC